MPSDSNEDQSPNEDEQSPLDKALERLKSDLKTRNGRIIGAVVAVALVVLIIGLVRACGGSGDPATSLSDAATEIAIDLNDAAVDVGDSSLDDIADDLTDAARRLARVVPSDHGDLEDLEESLDAVQDAGNAVERYVERAATIAEGSISEERADAALGATQRAASFVTGSSWNSDWTNLARIWWNLDFEENARSYDEKDADRYFEATETFAETDTARSKANAEYQVARAELAVASFGSEAARKRARDALEDAKDDLDDAERELERASDDFDYFYDLITWRERPFEPSPEPRVPEPQVNP